MAEDKESGGEDEQESDAKTGFGGTFRARRRRRRPTGRQGPA